MNPAAAATDPPGDPESTAGADRAELRIRRALAATWVLLGLQLIALFSFSWVIYHRWSNTWDYAIRYQGWWGIAHGNLDPFSSVAGRFFLQDHFELINWPLAPLSLLWPHGLWPLWIQDLMVVGAEIGAVLIVSDALRRQEWATRLPGWVGVALVALLLVADPWIYESVAFDFHYQTVGAACFALLACREMMGGSTRRLVVFSVLCLACGDIAATYLAAVGLGGVLAGRLQRRRGAVLVAAGIAWLLVAVLAGANQGSKFSVHYGYLAGVAPGVTAGLGAVLGGIVTHPGRAIAHLWSQRVDLWAYAGSAGLIGLLTPWAVLPVLVFLENGLSAGTGIVGTPYESFGAVLFLVPLSVIALGRLDRRLSRPRRVDHGALETTARPIRSGRLRSIGPVLAVVLAAFVLAWGIVWIPHVPGRWLQVSQKTASALDRVERVIPPGAEVVASQGVIGRFADRQWLYKFSGGTTFALHTPDTYFVIVPTQGIEIARTQEGEGLIAELRGVLHGRLLFERAGVWLVRVKRSSIVTAVTIERGEATLPAWIGRTRTGRAVLNGPVSGWHIARASDRRGYLLYGLKWQELPGRYAMETTLANAAPVELEVWDASANTLLARDRVRPHRSRATVETTVRVTQDVLDQPFSGYAPFRFHPTRPPPGDRIELRVVTRGSGAVSVFDATLGRSSG